LCIGQNKSPRPAYPANIAPKSTQEHTAMHQNNSNQEKIKLKIKQEILVSAPKMTREFAFHPFCLFHVLKNNITAFDTKIPMDQIWIHYTWQA
jgi:hypothetical protein